MIGFGMARPRKTPLERFAETGAADRKAAFIARRKQAGFVRLDVWVPADRADELRKIVADMVGDRLG